MKSSPISALISAIIFIAYGFYSNKIVFIGLGASFVLVAIAKFLQSRN